MTGSISLAKNPWHASEDVVLCIEKGKDILSRGLIVFIQIKKGKIDTPTWRDSIHSQLYELFDRQINTPPYETNDISSKVILITSGVITQPVRDELGRMNNKNHIPIEWFDGPRFIQFLWDNQYRLKDAKRDVKPRYFKP